MAKGFRPVVLGELRRMARNVRTIVARWDSPPSTWIYDAGDGRGRAQNPTRDRKDIPASEYQENNLDELRRLVEFMIFTRNDADRIIKRAEKRIMALEEAEDLAREEARP